MFKARITVKMAQPVPIGGQALLKHVLCKSTSNDKKADDPSPWIICFIAHFPLLTKTR
jgi:hypothetical protein